MSRMSSLAAADLSGMAGAGPNGPGSVEASASQEEAAPAESREQSAETQAGTDETASATETKTEEKPEEKKPEEVKESEVKKINNQIRALNRIQANQQKVAVQLETRAKELEAARVELESKAKELQQFEELANLKPLEIVMKVAEKKGVAFKDFLRSAIAHAATGEPEEEEEKPAAKEEELSPAMKKILDQINDLTSKLTAKEQAELEAQKRAEVEFEESLISGYVESTLSMVNENDFPVLDTLDQDELQAEVLSVSEKYAQKTGDAPDAKEVLEYLEEKYEQRAMKMSERLQKKSGGVKSSTETGNVSTPETGDGSPATSKKAEAPRALTNNMAGERGSGVEGTLRTSRDRIGAGAEYLATRLAR